jgi:hypothetical protein
LIIISNHTEGWRVVKFKKHGNKDVIGPPPFNLLTAQNTELEDFVRNPKTLPPSLKFQQLLIKKFYFKSKKIQSINEQRVLKTFLVFLFLSFLFVSVFFFICLCVCLSFHLSFFSSVFLFICLSFHLSFFSPLFVSLSKKVFSEYNFSSKNYNIKIVQLERNVGEGHFFHTRKKATPKGEKTESKRNIKRQIECMKDRKNIKK